MKLGKPKTRRAPAVRVPLPEAFEDLNRVHALRPIEDDAGLHTASELANRLAVLGRLSRDQADYLEVLSTLIEQYEAEHFAIETSGISSVEVLKYLMEANDMNASDLGRLLGERSLGAAILRGERSLSKAASGPVRAVPCPTRTVLAGLTSSPDVHPGGGPWRSAAVCRTPAQTKTPFPESETGFRV